MDFTNKNLLKKPNSYNKLWRKCQWKYLGKSGKMEKRGIIVQTLSSKIVKTKEKNSMCKDCELWKKPNFLVYIKRRLKGENYFFCSNCSILFLEKERYIMGSPFIFVAAIYLIFIKDKINQTSFPIVYSLVSVIAIVLLSSLIELFLHWRLISYDEIPIQRIIRQHTTESKKDI